MPFTAEESAKLKGILQSTGTNYYGAGSGLTARSEGKAPDPTKGPQVKAPSQNIFQKVADVTKQTFDIGKTVVGKTAEFAKNTPRYVYRDIKPFLKATAEYITGDLERDQANVSVQQDQLDQMQDQLILDYKSGKITSENYALRQRDLANSYQDLSKDSQKVATAADRGNVVESAAWTAATILSAGKLTPGKIGTKTAVEAFQAGGKDAVKSLVDAAANKFENLVMHVPAARALVERNVQGLAERGIKQLAGETFDQFVAREGKTLVTGMLLKRPLFYEQNIGGAKNIYNKLLEGDYGSAVKSSAWLATQMLEGGPIGAGAKGFSWLKGKLGDLSYGKGSYIDELSKLVGDGNGNSIAFHVKDSPESERIFRILQETNMQTTGENAVQAAENTLQPYIQAGVDLKTLTPEILVQDAQKWADAEALRIKVLGSGLVKGISPEDASKYAVVRWDTTTKLGAANKMAQLYQEAGGDVQKRLALFEQFAEQPGVGWSNNENLMERLRNIVVYSQTPEEAAKGIKAIETASVALDGLPKKIADQLGDLGYTIAAPFGGNRIPELDYNDIAGSTRKLVTAATEGNTDVFDVAKAPQPQLAMFARGLERSGLSPQAANGAANQKLSESLVANLDELNVGTNLGLKNSQGSDMVSGGRAILSQLKTYLDNKTGILGISKGAATDIRQLTPGEVSQALGLTKNIPVRGVPEEAKAISKAIMQAYLDVPMEFRGAGDKVVDALYRYNPLQKYYSRIQSAFRYTYNPFFRTQERVESALLSHAQADNFLWTKSTGGFRSRAELNEAAKALDNAGIFSSSLPGEAAADQVAGRISANITAGQKRSLAGLAYDIADSKGISLDKLINEHSDEVNDALRVVVQYPQKGVLASPLARTMNLMFFPVRYNAKVTQIAAKVLERQPPSVQLAVLHAGFKLKDWLKSDEGIAWQSAHADAIQVFNWLTPVNSIEYTMNLLGHKPDSLSALGQLGGLPLGFITQAMDSLGIINLNRPYVNPKSGELLPDYIPKTAKAKAATALTDLIGSMFTFPGRTLGLPGKEASIRKFVSNFIATNGKDFDKQFNTQDLTPLQQNWIRVLKGDTSKEAVDALYSSPAPGKFAGYTLPPLSLPERVDVPQTSRVPTRSETAALKASKKATGPKKKNKASPIPAR